MGALLIGVMLTTVTLLAFYSCNSIKEMQTTNQVDTPVTHLYKEVDPTNGVTCYNRGSSYALFCFTKKELQ